MNSINNVILLGYVGSEVIGTHSESAHYCRFTLATHEKSKSVTTEQHRGTNTTWHTIVCFGKLSELAQRHTGKGKRLYVEGKLRYRQWQDSSGQTIKVTEVIARQLVFIDGNATPSGATHTKTKDENEKAECDHFNTDAYWNLVSDDAETQAHIKQG